MERVAPTIAGSIGVAMMTEATSLAKARPIAGAIGMSRSSCCVDAGDCRALRLIEGDAASRIVSAGRSHRMASSRQGRRIA